MKLNDKVSAIIEKRAKSSRLSAQGVRNIKTGVAKALNFGRYFEDEASLLAAIEWMVNFEKGNTNDWRGHYFITGKDGEGKLQWMGYQEIIELALSEFGQSKEAQSTNLLGRIMELTEVENAKRIGPKGLFKPASVDFADKIQAIWSPKELPASCNMDMLLAALGDLRNLLPADSISPVGIDAAMRAIPIDASFEDEIVGLDPTKNSGPPWYKRNWSPHGYGIKDSQRRRAEMIFSWYREDAKRALSLLTRGKTIDLSAMAAQRLTQRGPDQLADNKYKRLVVAMMKTDAILCKMVTARLIPALRAIAPFKGSVRTFVALSDAPFVDIMCQVMMREAGKRTVLSTDFSGFDQTQVPWLIVEIGKVIAHWVRGGSIWVAKLVESMVYHTSILTPVGFFEAGPSSMKSGHGFTNLIDSLISLLNYFYGIRMGAWEVNNAMVQGDDGAADGEGIEPETFQEVSAQLGLEASAKKQFYEEGAMHYLQRLHFQGKLGGIYSVFRALGSVLSYERLKTDPNEWNPYLETMQTISRIDNTAFNPMHSDLTWLVANHDKYKLGSDLSPREVINRAGELWQEVLNDVRHETINASVSAGKGFTLSPTNRVLRGEKLPPFGSYERFVDVYRERATSAEKELGVSAKVLAA